MLSITIDPGIHMPMSANRATIKGAPGGGLPGKQERRKREYCGNRDDSGIHAVVLCVGSKYAGGHREHRERHNQGTPLPHQAASSCCTGSGADPGSLRVASHSTSASVRLSISASAQNHFARWRSSEGTRTSAVCPSSKPGGMGKAIAGHSCSRKYSATTTAEGMSGQDMKHTHRGAGLMIWRLTQQSILCFTRPLIEASSSAGNAGIIAQYSLRVLFVDRR